MANLEKEAITRLPKIELHLHLDTSLSYRVVSRLLPSVTREEYDREYVAPPRCANLAEFLVRSPKGYGLMQTTEGLWAVVEDVFDQLVADNVVYTELRFAPFLHLAAGLSVHEVVSVVDAAVDAMIARTGVEARVILCTLRHHTEAQGFETVRLVEAFRHRRVAALDLAGDEAGYSILPHVAAYRYARDHGIRTTAHAGEACGPESVWETLELLAPDRIGHGIRSIEDPPLVEHLRRSGMHLEVCPSSNVQLVESISQWSDHPIDRLYDAGVALNVNCDNRMLNGTSLCREYEFVAKHFGWTSAHFAATNLAALEHAFVDDETKRRLKGRLRADANQQILAGIHNAEGVASVSHPSGSST